MKTRYFFAALFLSLLTLPLLLDIATQINVSYIASGLRLYQQQEIGGVAAPISVAMLNIELSKKLYNVPLLVTPSNGSSVGAVALVGVYKELLYNQRSEFYFKSPYVRKSTFFTAASLKKESIWKNYGSMYHRNLYLHGRIIKLYYEYRGKHRVYGPDSPYLRMCGMTDAFEVFLLSPHLDQIWVNHGLAELLADDTSHFNVLNFTKFAVSMDENHVFVSAYGITDHAYVFVFTAALLVADGAIDWVNRGTVNPLDTAHSYDVFLSSIRISIEERPRNEHFDDLQFLREYSATNPHRYHGETTFIYQLNDSVVFRTDNLIFALSKHTGVELAAFLFTRNTLLTTNSKNELMLYSIADEYLLVQRLDGQHFDEIVSVLVYERVLHQRAVAQAEKRYKVHDALFASYKGDLYTIVTSATDEAVYTFYNDKLMWMRPISGVYYISIHRIYPNLIVVIATTNITCYIFWSVNGYVLAYFPFDSTRHDFMANEELNRIHAGITVARIHAFMEEKSILIQRDALIDVLSIRNGARFSLIIELGAALFSTAVLYGVITTVSLFRQSKRE